MVSFLRIVAAGERRVPRRDDRAQDPQQFAGELVHVWCQTCRAMQISKTKLLPLSFSSRSHSSSEIRFPDPSVIRHVHPELHFPRAKELLEVR